MSLTKLTANLNNVRGLPDKPNLDTDELKATFDEAGNTIKDYINEVLTGEIDIIESNLKKLIQTNTNLIDNNQKNIFNLVYPIGSIYMSTNNINPTEIFGGNWIAWGSGRAVVGVDASQTEFSTVEKTGGEKTHKLTTAEMPSHTHIFTGVTHYHSLGEHTHSFNATTSTKNLTGKVQDFAVQSDVTGVGTSGVFSTQNPSGGNVGYASVRGGGTSSWSDIIQLNASHNHTVSGTTGKATGNTSNVTTGGTNSSVGGDTSHNILQPYITCYMWKRIA